MYISNVIVIIFYLLDLVAAFAVTGPVGCLFVAVALPIVIWIQEKLCILESNAIKLDDLNLSDQDTLRSMFDTVLEAAEKNGFYFHGKNPKIYLVESDEPNAFNCGNSIVINRGILDSPYRNGVTVHEIKHWKFHDSYCSMLISSTVYVFFLMLMFLLGASITFIVVFVSIIFGIIFGSTLGFIAGSIIGRILNFLKKIITNTLYYVIKFLETALSRFTEYKADEFAAICSFTYDVIRFLESIKDQDLLYSSLAERVLSTHPTCQKRINRLKKIEKQLEYNETLSLLFDV